MRPINFLPLSSAIILITILAYGIFYINNDSKSYIYTLSQQELTSVSGQKVKLKDLKGQYYLVHLFASWCSSCHADHLILNEIKKSTNIPIIGIALNDKKDNLIRQDNSIYDIVCIDQNNNILKLLQNKLLPETIIINKEGIVEFRYLGSLNKNEVEKNIIPTLLTRTTN